MSSIFYTDVYTTNIRTFWWGSAPPALVLKTSLFPALDTKQRLFWLLICMSEKKLARRTSLVYYFTIKRIQREKDVGMTVP